jgi:Holliday junction resolvase RusA-like endonuclease
MKPIQIIIDGDPKPQPRPRAFARNMGGGKFAARVYDAGTAEGWKSLVALAAKPFLPESPHDMPLHVTMVFFFARPKAHFTGKGALRTSSPSHPTSRNDLDNLCKAVMDCLTQIGMWKDDGQVVRLIAQKEYGENPGAVVKIEQAIE